MNPARLFRHMFATHWATRLCFPATALDAIEEAIQRAEERHCGEIRFAIETSLPLLSVWNDVSPRDHAMSIFANLGVWNTEHNNGVLIYLQLADRDVEIIADRGIEQRVSRAEWETACGLMEAHFRARRFQEGAIAGVEAVGSLLARHFPASGGRSGNQLSDRPVLI